MLTPRSFFGGSQRTSQRHFDIVPDSPFVVLYGEASQAESAYLTGKIVLDCPDPIEVTSVRVNLTGWYNVKWWTNTVSPVKIQDKKRHHMDSITLTHFPDGSTTSHKLRGHHEWEFKFEIPGDMMESVEGLSCGYIIYELNAIIERPGLTTKDIHAAKRHIRIIRTLPRITPDDLSYDQVNEDVWSNKISYKITVPRKNYIFGTSVTADFRLTPLRKGLAIGKIKMEIHEKVILKHTDRGTTYSHDRVYCSHEQGMPDNCERYITDEETDPDSLMDEAYAFHLTMPLPKSLAKLRVAVDTEPIKIEHRLKIFIDLHNPEGHTSQLLVKNLFYLFISPHYAPDENNTVPDGPASEEAQESVVRRPNQTEAPPTYGEHQFDKPVDEATPSTTPVSSGNHHDLDQLYEGIDTAGFMTPAARPGSGSNTPFYAQSRSGSEENLASIDAIAHDTSHGGPSSHDLHSRLARVQEHGSSHWARQQGHTPHHASYTTSGAHTPRNGLASRPHSGADHPAENPYFPTIQTTTTSSGRQSGANSAPHSTSHSRRASGEHHDNSPGSPAAGAIHMEDYDMDALSRTPSYNTAIRTPARDAPIRDRLPTYEVATSRPPSPQHDEAHPPGSGSRTPTGLLQRPAQAHTRSPARTTHRSYSDLASLTDELAETTIRNTQFNAGRVHRTSDPERRSN